jgi:hypothetical protein
MQVIYPLNMLIQSNEAIFRGTCAGWGKTGPENPAGPQTVQQGLPAAPSYIPPPTGKEGGQPPMPFPSPTEQQGQPPVAFPLPAGQQGKPAAGDGDCLTFNAATTKVQQSQGAWSVVDGPRTLFSFGFDRIEAENTLAIIKHYGMNRSCFVGYPRASFHYMLAGGSAPVGPFPGEDCRSFNPAMMKALWIKGWTIMDGNNALFQFDSDKDGADQALAILRRYGFTHSCVAAGGKVDFLYLRR